MVLPIASKADSRGFKLVLSSLDFRNLSAIFNKKYTYHYFFGNGKHREETGIHLESKLMMCSFQSTLGPRGPGPGPFIFRRGLCPAAGRM